MNNSKQTNTPPVLSVIIPVTERFDDVQSVYNAYKQGVETTNLSYEFIYVLDGDFPSVTHKLRQLIAEGEHITIIKLAKWFGEATALTVGFDHSSGEIILTLPAYLQVQPAGIPHLIEALKTYDIAIACRYPRADSFFSHLKTKAFHLPLKYLTGQDFHDLGCGARAMKRRVADELEIYGDQHRFLPLLAYRKGFKVSEVNLEQAPDDAKQRGYSAGVYLRRTLDILAIFFLLKFTKKPFRFFGLLGTGIFGLGIISFLYLLVDRLAFNVALADRPLLLFSSLLVVLGIQIFAIGLIGEIIIFTHAKDIKEYTIEEIVN